MSNKIIVEHKSKLNNEITQVKLDNGSFESKTDVIDNIGKGDLYKTVSSTGPKVIAYPKTYPKYIKTKDDETKEDNLGTLKTY